MRVKKINWEIERESLRERERERDVCASLFSGTLYSIPDHWSLILGPIFELFFLNPEGGKF